MGKKFAVGLVLLLFPIFLHAQAVSPVTPKLATINAGGYFSYGQMDYGQHHNIGLGAYGDFDYRIWREVGVGIEGEARFMNFDEKSGVYDQNFLGGPRVTYRLGRRWLPYVKFLAGGTRFHYPPFVSNQVYNYTTLAGGGGIDFKLNDRWTIRPADFEYQRLIDYPPTGLTPWVYSAGVSFRIF
ncbi:MAG: outer membrane beta-barrel protein [Acidobacteriaceae bacterium]